MKNKHISDDDLAHYYGFRVPLEFVDQETGFAKREIIKWLQTSCKDTFKLENFVDRLPNGKIGYAVRVYLKNEDDAIIYRLFWT